MLNLKNKTRLTVDDVLVAAHDAMLPAVEGDLYAREK